VYKKQALCHKRFHHVMFSENGWGPAWIS